MCKQLDYIDEPKLRFGYNQTAEDSRDGLTLFGPYESAKGKIRVGYIGTERGLHLYSSFVDKINKPIYTSSLGRPFFPGFKTVFGLEWPNMPSATIILKEDQIDAALAISNLKERTYNIVSLYLEPIQSL